MRRSAKLPSRGERVVDPILQLRVSQVTLIGAVTLVWNYVEWALDDALSAALRLAKPMELEVTSRINGIDGKIALIKAAAKSYGFSQDDFLTICATLASTEEHKRYRDGIIHAKIISRELKTAPTAQRKGKTDEVLVSEEALQSLYNRLMALQEEMLLVAQVFILLSFTDVEPKLGEDDKRLAAAIAPESLAQLRKSQKNRLALPPLPKFPEEPQVPLEKEAPKEPEH